MKYRLPRILPFSLFLRFSAQATSYSAIAYKIGSNTGYGIALQGAWGNTAYAIIRDGVNPGYEFVGGHQIEVGK